MPLRSPGFYRSNLADGDRSMFGPVVVSTERRREYHRERSLTYNVSAKPAGNKNDSMKRAIGIDGHTATLWEPAPSEAAALALRVSPIDEVGVGALVDVVPEVAVREDDSRSVEIKPSRSVKYEGKSTLPKNGSPMLKRFGLKLIRYNEIYVDMRRSYHKRECYKREKEVRRA